MRLKLFTHFSTFKQPEHRKKNGCFLMLPLPTEATVEAMNVSTDRRHPFHTYNDRNRFRQFGFTQQNIVVDIDDIERDMEISNGKGSLRIRYSNSLILQHKRTYLFLSYFSSPAIIQTTPLWLGRSFKNMHMDEPESWNHFATDSLNRSLLEQSAAIIASLKIFF